jgi:hypothetical protein
MSLSHRAIAVVAVPRSHRGHALLPPRHAALRGTGHQRAGRSVVARPRPRGQGCALLRGLPRRAEQQVAWKLPGSSSLGPAYGRLSGSRGARPCRSARLEKWSAGGIRVREAAAALTRAQQIRPHGAPGSLRRGRGWHSLAPRSVRTCVFASALRGWARAPALPHLRYTPTMARRRRGGRGGARRWIHRYCKI